MVNVTAVQTCQEIFLRKINLEYENGKQLQVTLIKITESKENKSTHRHDFSGSAGPWGSCPLVPPPPRHFLFFPSSILISYFRPFLSLSIFLFFIPFLFFLVLFFFFFALSPFLSFFLSYDGVPVPWVPGVPASSCTFFTTRMYSYVTRVLLVCTRI